jgi:selenocysteine-specific elongation factor
MHAAAAEINRLVRDGRLVQDEGVLRLPGMAAAAPDPAETEAMGRLEAMLAVVAPPGLADAARVAGCPPSVVRELERAGRIVVLEPDLAYAQSTYRDLTAQALDLAAHEPLTPAAFRDATGTSRKYVMAILEDLDRRGILRRTPAGHVPGPKAPAIAGR